MKMRPPSFLVLTGLLVLGSCVRSDSPTQVNGPVSVPLAIQPAIVPSPANADALPINRVRARVTRVEGGAVLGETEVDVSPSAAEWALELAARVQEASTEVRVVVALLHVADGGESVEFSGMTGPFTIRRGEVSEATEVDLVRGPLANFYVTGVAITEAPDTIYEGQAAPVDAAVTTSLDVEPQVFLTVLEPSILSATDSSVTGLLPGTARVVASAGAFTDTASVVVQAAPAEVLVSPGSIVVPAAGDTAVFSAAVVDARGDTLPQESVVWSSGSPAVATSLGGGSFEAVSEGSATVQAASAFDGSIVGTATMVVEASAPGLALTAAADDPSPADGDTVQVSVTVVNGAGSSDASEVAVTHRPGAELTVLAATPDQGSYDLQTGVWSVGALTAGSSTGLTLDLAVGVGTGGSTAVDSLWISAASPVDPDTSNDTASVSLAIAPRNVDVAVTKSVDNAQPLAGTSVTFTVSVANNGPGPVTDVAIHDSLDVIFESPTQTLSTGSLVGDTLWTIPSLAAGDTATWLTTATVSANATGASATNTALLRALAQNDTTASNDAASVEITVPLSEPPVVSMILPPDSSVFDPGEVATFEASATDPEDGDVSASIEWTSSLDGPLATGPLFETDQLSTGVHTITATATDSDGGTGSASITVTVALYTVPATLNVPFGGTASLPITLSEPAPAGGITLNVASDDGTVTQPQSSTVFISGGAQAANATLQGLAPGTATVSVSNAQFGIRSSAVSVTAQLDIQQTSLTFGSEFTETIDIAFESQGSPIAAPTGGLVVDLTPRDPACVSAPSPVTIPQGQTSLTTTISYGGTATLPCQAFLVATSPSVESDSVDVDVVAPPQITVRSETVGAGLQEPMTLTLPLSNHGGVTVTLTSADPQTLLLAPDGVTEGTGSIQVDVPDGQSSVTYWIQGLEGATGSVLVTASATGFTDGSNTSNVVQPGIMLGGLIGSRTTLSPDDDFYAFIGYPSGNGVSTQQIRAGGQPVTVTFVTNDTGVGLLTDGVNSGASATAVIPVGDDNTPTTVASGGVAHDLVGVGTATISATAPNAISTTNASQDVTVSAPGITVRSETVGAGLQEPMTLSLGASTHGGVTVTLTSENPQILLLAPDGSTEGMGSIQVDVPDGQSSVTYWIQGWEGTTGSVLVTASAAGFTDGSNTSNVVQPGIMLGGLNSSTTTLSEDDDFYAFIGYPSGNGVSTQQIRAGGQPVTVTFATNDTGVGLLTDGVNSGRSATAVIPVGDDNTPTTVANGGVAHDPVGAGTATISATAPNVISTTNASQDVTVSAPGITVRSETVGAGLQEPMTLSLGSSTHGGVTVTLTSENPQILLLARDGSTEGTGSIEVDVPDGQSSVTYWIQGWEGTTGSVLVTASAAGFTDGSNTSNVVQPGVMLGGLTGSTTTLSVDDEFYAFIGYPSGNGVSTQQIRAGGQPVTVTFSTNDTGVGLLTDGVNSGRSATAVIPIGDDNTPTTVANGGVAHDPVGVGTATISATAPNVISTTNASQDVTVSAPGITVRSETVGAGLQEPMTLTLGTNTHGGVTVTLTSADPQTLVLAPDGATEGTSSIDVDVPDGQSSVTYWIQGLEGASGSVLVTASAAGFTDGSNTSSVVQAGIMLGGLTSSSVVDAAQDEFYAFIGYPSGNGVNTQQIRVGGQPVTVTFSTNDTGVGLLTDGVNSGASATAVIPIGDDNTPTTVANGGVAHDPVGVGTATITATAPGTISTTNATQDVTINP